ncbi:MAG TPA: hypothetical protein VNI02_09625 [Blastocatellia bacterium]|nr:hypothetical protein [Blastocatellia bacterium]
MTRVALYTAARFCFKKSLLKITTRMLIAIRAARKAPSARTSYTALLDQMYLKDRTVTIHPNALHTSTPAR